jgi:ELWxxDGT repeat protein
MKKVYPLIFLLLICTTGKSQFVQKITSMNYYGYNGLNPSNITVFNGKLYFFGTNDVEYVDYLMCTPDGSASGVTVVKQIDTMKQYPQLRHLTVLNNLVIFDNHSQLWKSDGTQGGTSSIATLGISSTNYVVLNNKVYFGGDVTNSNPVVDQLWQTDGTATGTTLVKTINATGAAYISNMFVNDGKIFFGATDGINSFQLWISDGTAAGTTMLKKLNPTGESSPSYFIAYNGKVYFGAEDGINGTQLWVSDGTTAGTQEITTINGTDGLGLQPSTFTIFNSNLFFMGIDKGAFYQLWKTDGTTSGTITVKTDYTPRTYSGFLPSSMAVYNNKLYMSGYDSLTSTAQLWVSDGTTNGTTKVTHFAHGLSPGKLYPFGNKLIMTGYDTVSNEEQLFASDGTAAGTVCPTPPGTAGGTPFYPWYAWVPFNNALYFSAAYTFWSDYQLCRYSETPFGIAEQTLNKLSVYPNPTDGVFHVSPTKPTSQTFIEIYNLNGGLIYKQTAINAISSIDLTNYPTGLYVLKVMNDNQTIGSQKILKK